MARAFVIPSSPEDREDIKKKMGEIHGSKIRAEAESTFQKETLKLLHEKYQIPKKELARMAKEYHNDELRKAREEFSDYTDLVDAVFPEVSEEEE